MAFTSFRSDPARIKKEMEIFTYEGRYMLDVPGPGAGAPFQEDPQIRLQLFGANTSKTFMDVDNDLRGIGRKYTRGRVDYKTTAIANNPVSYSSVRPFVDESRASLPAWTFRDLEQTRWEIPIHDPQSNLEKPFEWIINTRNQERDNFRPVIPVLMLSLIHI